VRRGSVAVRGSPGSCGLGRRRLDEQRLAGRVGAQLLEQGGAEALRHPAHELRAGTQPPGAAGQAKAYERFAPPPLTLLYAGAMIPKEGG
jgi:hypothetical protein